MKIRDLIIEKLSEYILREVDQLSGGVTDFFETTCGGSDEHEGDCSFGEVFITYRVPVEVDRRAARGWGFPGTLESLIKQLDRMEKN